MFLSLLSRRECQGEIDGSERTRKCIGGNEWVDPVVISFDFVIVVTSFLRALAREVPFAVLSHACSQGLRRTLSGSFRFVRYSIPLAPRIHVPLKSSGTVGCTTWSSLLIICQLFPLPRTLLSTLFMYVTTVVTNEPVFAIEIFIPMVQST